MCDCVRIMPYKYIFRACSSPMCYRVQMKSVWLRIGPVKFFKWKTIGEYNTYDCAVLDAKTAVKCLNNEWKDKR